MTGDLAQTSPMTETTGGLGAVLARITASGTHDDGQLLAQLVDELRPDDADDTAQATKNLRHQSLDF